MVSVCNKGWEREKERGEGRRWGEETVRLVKKGGGYGQNKKLEKNVEEVD